MKIQYCSDLHLEFEENKNFLKQFPIKPEGDILLLAGDIVLFKLMKEHDDFFSYLSDHFEVTYWIPGNHEYYHFDAAEKSGILNERIKTNVYLVNNTTVVHDTVKFIFSTLWTRIRPAYEWQIEKGVSDFHVIKYKGYRFSATQYNSLHEECLQFIKKELHEETINKKVVVTHHVPTVMNYPEKYKGSILNDAFVVELFDLIEAIGPDFWIYGHHHTNTNAFTIGSTNMLTNQLGYIRNNEHIGFNNNTCIVTINYDIQYNKAKFAQ